ncbi:hypothetical protein C2S52_016082, partial [Perilla frutescens var. hirtella]
MMEIQNSSLPSLNYLGEKHTLANTPCKNFRKSSSCILPPKDCSCSAGPTGAERSAFSAVVCALLLWPEIELAKIGPPLATTDASYSTTSRLACHFFPARTVLVDPKTHKLNMDLPALTLFLVFISGVLILIPRLRKSDRGQSVQPKFSSQFNYHTEAMAEQIVNAIELSRTAFSGRLVHGNLWKLFLCFNIYDVTSYVEEHPGGDAILAHAGDDSTEGFFGPQHATRVFDMIEDFFIGHL